MDKKVYQLFIGKVADEIGMDKCSQLLKESSDCFKDFDAIGSMIEQVNDIRFSPIHFIRHFSVFSLNKFEKELGMPQGYLSKAINNKRALPKEWEATLKKYLLNLAKNINEKMAY